MGVASRVAAWGRRFPRHPAALPTDSLGTGNTPGVPILTGTGLAVNLVVEIAWGALITFPFTTWTWTDVTKDALYQGAIQITIGRSDEASQPQPASCQFTLNNTSGNYTFGPQSANYPNVLKNVPIRVSVWYQGRQYIKFFGYSTGFSPQWDTSGNFAYVKVAAAGAKRRLQKEDQDPRSVLTRSIPTLTDLVAYWPCEDGSGATSIASGIQGQSSMSIVGAPELAANSSFLCSSPIPIMNNGSFYGGCIGPNTGAAQVRAMVAFPPTAEASPDTSVIFRVFVSGGQIAFWNVRYYAGGGLGVVAYDQLNNQIYDSGVQGYTVNGQLGRLSFSVAQSGGNLAVQLSWYQVGATSAGYSNFTVTGQTVGYCTGVTIAPFGDQTNVAIGQVFVESAQTDIFQLSQQVNAFVGEFVGTRMPRLASENAEYVNIIGPTTQQLGPQGPDNYLNLMQGCAQVDLGYLCDGLAQGLTFITKDVTTSQGVNMTLDASLGQIAPDLTPVDDDLLIVNKFWTSRTNGSTQVFALNDTSDPLNVFRIGVYSDSATLDFLNDGEQLYDYSAWMVHVGTNNDYRWTPLDIWLHRNPELLQQWLNILPTDRIDVINLGAVRGQLSNIPISTLLQGWTETIDQFLWSIQANTTPYEPYRVGILANTTGDTGEFLVHLDTDGAQLTSPVSVGASSFQVTTPSGPVWTTASDDFPLIVDVGGWPVTVTTITGATSPQTFTVDPTTVVATLLAGTAVKVWQPAVLDVISYIAGQ